MKKPPDRVRGNLTVSPRPPYNAFLRETALSEETNYAAVADMEKSLLFRMETADARSVAQAGYRGFRRGRLLVIPGLKNNLGVLAVRFTPRFLIRKVVKRLQLE